MSPEFNFHKASTFIRSAAQQGAHLAVLPEYHLTNWVPNDEGFWDICLQWKTYLDKYVELAKDCKICIVPGTIVEASKDEETGKGKLLNVCYFISHDGQILGRYEKKNLWYLPFSCHNSILSRPVVPCLRLILVLQAS